MLAYKTKIIINKIESEKLLTVVLVIIIGGWNGYLSLRRISK